MARAHAACVAPVMKTGMRSFLASVASPYTWSECSWVMRIADKELGSSPRTFSRLKVSRQEIPASTRIFVRELATNAQFPLLPLASIETVTHMPGAYTPPLWIGSNFSVIQYLGVYQWSVTSDH